MYKKIFLLTLIFGTFFLGGCVWFSQEETRPIIRPTPITPLAPIVVSSTDAENISPTTVSSVCERQLKNITLRFHSSKQILQALVDEPNPCMEEGTYTLTLLNPKALLGTITNVSYGGNSGGIFVPFAIAKDDQSILLRAHMWSPGAGGGSIDYGYSQIFLKGRMGLNTPITDFPIVATSQAYFYDTFGKVIYIEEGENTPVTAKPGPGNNSVIMWRDLVSGEKRILLNEKDTSYEVLSLDEKTNTLKFKATLYQFSAKCPRELEGSLSCARTTTTIRSIIVPQK